MKKTIKIAVIILALLSTIEIYSQNKKATVTSETRKVLYYQVEEYINQSFGGTKTSYTVSDLRLISSDELGPDNIRTITPVYKREVFTDKSYEGGEEKTRAAVVQPSIEKPVAARSPKEVIALQKDSRLNLTPVGGSKETTVAKKTSTPNTIATTKPKEVIEPKKVLPMVVAPVSKPAESTAVKKDSKLNLTPVKITNEVVETKPVSRLNLTPVKITNEVVENKPVSKLNLTPVSNPIPMVEIKSQPNQTRNIITSEPNTSSVETTDQAEKAVLDKLVADIRRSAAESATSASGGKVTSVYINIIDTYERIAEKGYRSAYVFRIIADSFYFSNKMDKAARWYTELFSMTTNLDPVYYYRYGTALKKTGNTPKGTELVDKFIKLTD